jgi:hypothetical protein
VQSREVLRETREEVAKSGDVLRESQLVFFERGRGGREIPPSFLFSLPAKVEIRANSKQKHPVKQIFSVQNEILGEKIQGGEEGNTPKKVDFAPKVAESDEKGWFWGRNSREGIERKNGFYCLFCNVMKWQNGRK